LGRWNGSSLTGAGVIFEEIWDPSGYDGVNWNSGSPFDQTMTLQPRDYAFEWFAELNEGSSNPLVGATGSGTLQFAASLAIGAGASPVPAASPGLVAALATLLTLAGSYRLWSRRRRARGSQADR
jgi:hypothetical protein